MGRRARFLFNKSSGWPTNFRLQNLEIGHKLLLRPKPVGTLVLDPFLPWKKFFFLFSTETETETETETGIAPFVSVFRDPETYEEFEEVIITQTCRDLDKLDFWSSVN